MLIEFHCTCGHRQPLTVDKLKPSLKCAACKEVRAFVSKGSRVESVTWLALGGQTGPPRLAVPVPVGVAMRIGRAASGFLCLPGEEVEEAQTELCVEEDGRVHVKHLAGDSGTWINRAKILTGIFGMEDRLRIGPYVMRLMTHGAVQQQLEVGIEPEVIIEAEAEVEPRARRKPGRRRPHDAEPEVIIEEADEEVVAPADDLSPEDGRWSTGQKVRMVASALVVLAAAVFLGRSYIWPPVSDEMPVETTFYCPADGIPVKGRWTAASGAPICPQCGQRCVGELKYKAEPTDAPPEAATTSGPADGSGETAAADAKPADAKAADAKPAGKKPSKKKRARAQTPAGPDGDS